MRENRVVGSCCPPQFLFDPAEESCAGTEVLYDSESSDERVFGFHALRLLLGDGRLVVAEDSL
jgi:hypothetical protein